MPMAIEAEIKSALAAIAGGRTYPDTTPDKPVFPLNIYQQVGGEVINPLEGTDPNKDNARIQVTTWSKSPVERATVAREVRVALTSTLNATLLASPVSIYDDTLKLYGARADYSVWFTP
jgi:hypothetical protein